MKTKNSLALSTYFTLSIKHEQMCHIQVLEHADVLDEISR